MIIQTALLGNELHIQPSYEVTQTCDTLVAAQSSGDLGEDSFPFSRGFALALTSGGLGVDQFTSLNVGDFEEASSMWVSGWDDFNILTELAVKRH